MALVRIETKPIDRSLTLRRSSVEIADNAMVNVVRGLASNAAFPDALRKFDGVFDDLVSASTQPLTGERTLVIGQVVRIPLPSKKY